MTAVVIPLHPDAYLPLRFETPQRDAYEMHDDYELATKLLQFAQTARNEIYQRGEPLSFAKRQTLIQISYLIDEFSL
jgi:hypothetical protein